MNKTAIVTGAGRGIGLAIAKKLGSQGIQTVLFATSPEEHYHTLIEELRQSGICCIYVSGSLSSKEDRCRLVQKTLDEYGRIDILVNNAGVAPKERVDLLEMSEESYDRVLDINAKGTFFLTQLVASQMITQTPIGPKKGTIINIGSCSAAVSSVNRGEYCISKAAVSMMTTLFADRLALENILVHEIRPGVIRTDMTSKVTEKYDRLISEGLFPIARWGTPEDVANAVALYASDEILYTTGDVVDVDGGFHIRRL